MEEEPKVRMMSPSQISLWQECKRKWSWRHVAKIVLPPHKSAALGTDTHSQLETVLSGGAIDFTRPSGYIAAELLPLLPPPKSPGMELEKHFKYTSPSGSIYHGYMDVVVPDSSVFPDLLKPGWPRAPAVSDHKTTSNFKYAKTSEDLRTDPQGVIYAVAAMDMFKSTAVDLVWHYTLTKGPKQAKRTHLRVFAPDVVEPFKKIEAVNLEIGTTYTSGKQPLDLPAPEDLRVCDGFGGCPYRHLCTDLSPINRRKIPMTQSTQEMLDNLKSKANGEASAVPGLPAWATAAKDPLAGLLPPVVAVNPPEFQPAPIANVAPTAEKTKRARRTKAQMAADEAALLIKDQVPMEIQTGDFGESRLHQIQEPPQNITKVPNPLTNVLADGFTLYVDCYPVGGAYISAEHLFAQAAKQLKVQGVEDYRLVEFGKGSGMFAGLVNDISLCGDVVLDSRTPEGTLCLASLSARANRVVRGLR